MYLDLMFLSIYFDIDLWSQIIDWYYPIWIYLEEQNSNLSYSISISSDI